MAIKVYGDIGGSGGGGLSSSQLKQLTNSIDSIDKRIQSLEAPIKMIAGANRKAFLTDWDALGSASSSGEIKDMVDVGTLIHEPWIDTADNNKEYDNPWRINDFSDHEEDINGKTVSGTWIQTKYTHPFGVQFSHQRAFLACPDGLAAGTYHFDFASDWGNNLKKGITYQFTLTKSVEAGGRLAGCYGAPDQSPSTWKVYSYGADGITLNETVAVSTGSAGTNLGTMQATKRQGNLNCFQEIAYGNNRWKTSALRQYLNSDQTKGNWWKPQDAWDIAPDQLAAKDGFLCGMDPEMLRNILPVKMVTMTNNTSDGDVEDVTYDKIIIPSLEQMYINPQVSGEGTAQAYWQELNGTPTKWERWQTYEILKQYIVTNHTSSQFVRLRSAFRGDAYSTWYVYASGGVYSSYASTAHVFQPLAFIHR